MSKLLKALAIADAVEHIRPSFAGAHIDAAAKLRRQHAEIERLREALQGMVSCWTSACVAHGWEPDHVVEATAARAALERKP